METAAAQHHHLLPKPRVWVPLVVGIALVGLWLSLGPIFGWLTQRQLDKLEGMQGTFSRVTVSLWRSAYDLHDLKVREEPLSATKEPVLYAKHIQIRWQWSQLLRLRLVGSVKVWNAKLVLDRTPHRVTPKEVLLHKVERKLPPPEQTPQSLARLPSFRLVRADILDAEVLFIDRGSKELPRLWVHDIQTSFENFASRRNLMGGKPFLVGGRGVVQRSGKIDLFLTADPFDQGLTFAGSAQLRGLRLADLHELMEAKTGAQATQGSIDMYASFESKRGVFNGGVEPLLKQAHFEPAKPGLGPKLKAAALDAAKNTLSDRVPGRQSVAAIIPIHGRLGGPDLQLAPAILSVLRNAFVEGLTASLTSVPPPVASQREGLLHQAHRTLSKESTPAVKSQPASGAKKEGK